MMRNLMLFLLLLLPFHSICFCYGSMPGPAVSVFPGHSHPHHRHHHHHHNVMALSPAPSVKPGCDQICLEPMTSTPLGSPCGCVFPMKVKLLMDVPPYVFFQMVNELEIEIAGGVYMKQSQVRIVGAATDTQNQGRTVVDINLVPLGQKFDVTTASLTYDRFVQKKVPLNDTFFGHYKVLEIHYPGSSFSPSSEGFLGNGPTGSPSSLPVSANVLRNNAGINSRTIAVIALSGFVISFVCIGAVFILIKWKARRASFAVGPVFTSFANNKSGNRSIISSSVGNSTPLSRVSMMGPSVPSVKTFLLADIEEATDRFSSKKILGEGGFGCVYHGILEGGVEVAVKLLTRDNQNKDQEFFAEVEMLSRLHHRNLVKLLGICVEGHTRCLVYELVSNGSVESHLHGDDKKKGPLEWDARLKIALGSARGLAYLHEDSNPRVIHRDFKASNILLEDDFTPKVSDFGLAREATEVSRHISTRVMGTFGYVAPEYAMTGHLLVKSDVYSYGVVLLELLSGRKPVDMSRPPGQENLVTWARPLLASREGLHQLADPALDRTQSFDDVAKVAAIASMCVHPEVTHRPFMGEVVQALKLIYNDTDETGGDCCSHRESSSSAPEFRGEFGVDSSWSGGSTAAAVQDPVYGRAPSFVTMEYSSGPLEDVENRPLSGPGLLEGRLSFQLRHGGRSGPLMMIRSKPGFYRLKGSMSEHGRLLPPGRFWDNADLV